MTKKYLLIPVGILIVGAIIMILLISLKSDPPKRKPVVQSKTVQVKVVKLKNVRSEIIVFGRLTSSQPVILYSEVAGILEKGSVPFLPATKFKKGDLLIKVDNRQAKLDLNSMKSDFLNALASVLPEIKVDFPDEYQKYQRYFDNCSFESRLNELPETTNQKIKLFLTRFNVYKLYYSTKNLEIRLDKHYFYAPFDGSIVSADLRIASTVRVGSMIGQIINLENLEVEAPVATNDVYWIDQNEPVILTSSELGGEWKGTINRIGTNIDERTQTVQVFIGINKNGVADLINGIFLKAKIPGQIIQNAMNIPNRAVYDDSFVYLVNDGKLEFRKVNIARRQMDSVIVNNGIANGDTLVTELLQGVAPGMPATTMINGR
jgi:multidrug efflux pump subunit AcrA (membrane-fusion protein)